MLLTTYSFDLKIICRHFLQILGDGIDRKYSAIHSDAKPERIVLKGLPGFRNCKESTCFTTY